MSRKFTLAKDRKTAAGSQRVTDTANQAGPQRTPAVLRMMRDVQELSLPDCASVHFDDPNDLLHYNIRLSPSEGYYRGQSISFSVEVGANYPIQAPKVKCTSHVFHPNIDGEGNVCLNILRSEWRPVLDINSLVYGLLHLLYEPSHEDALNDRAAEILRTNPHVFEIMAQRSIS